MFRDLSDKWTYKDPNTVLLLCLATAAAFGIYEVASGRTTSPAILAVFVILGLGAFYYALRKAFEQRTHQVREAGRLHLATVEALATAIDARDQIGFGHVRRTQIYAVGLGEILGLGECDINSLHTGALLHDIGKLAVPDHILNKPGSLTASEMEKVKIHASVGASILEKVGFPYPVVPTVRYHHEFWDGSGYPEGLKGRNIPLTARILAIADAYDSAREVRPYRHAQSKEQAISYLRARSGGQFDPMLTELFLKNLPIFEAEIRRCGVDYEAVTIDALATIPADDSRSTDYVEQIKRANREAYTLYSLAREFGTSLDMHETLELFVAKLAAFIPFDSVGVYLLDENGESARASHAFGAHAAALSERTVMVGHGPTGVALARRKPVWNADPTDEATADGMNVMCAIPLVANDELLGAVELYSSQVPRFQEDHLRIAETISQIAADAIDSALRHAEAESHALTDPLTGLPNSRSLAAQFEREVTRASRSGSRFQLVVMDLDGFKSVNDNFGHKAGDAVLRAIGKAIKGELREYDFLARYGGDEFVAIVPEADTDDARSLHDRIERVVRECGLPVDSPSTCVGISIGTAMFPDDGQSFDSLIEAADKAMYADKANNRAAPDDEFPTPEEVDEWLRSETLDRASVRGGVVAASTAIN